MKTNVLKQELFTAIQKVMDGFLNSVGTGSGKMKMISAGRGERNNRMTTKMKAKSYRLHQRTARNSVWLDHRLCIGKTF